MYKNSFYTYTVIAVCLIALPFWASAQSAICTGSLGENIFIDGSFGSGSSNTLTQDPKIAPGYRYVTNRPPGDGEYTITNNSNLIPGLFGTWLGIGDNSDDPNGYYMLVNADYNPGIFYSKKITGLCEDTKYEFSADVLNIVKTPVTNHILPNVSFLIDEVEMFTTGGVPQNEKWNNFGFTFITGPDQTELELTLRNNAPGGIGNDLAIDNITFRPCGPDAYILLEGETDIVLSSTISSLCEDGNPLTLSLVLVGNEYDDPVYQWQESLDGGFTWMDIPGANDTTFVHDKFRSGYYHYRFLVANSMVNLQNSKCRIISTVKILEVVPKFISVIDTICQGNGSFISTNGYYQTGIYTDSLISSLGCDSIVTLNLTVMEDLGMKANLLVSDPICAGDSKGAIQVKSIQNGYPPISLELVGVGASITNAGLFASLQAETYQLLGTDYFGCVIDTLIELVDPEPFMVTLKDSIQVQLGDPVSETIQANYPLTSVIIDSDTDILTCNSDCSVLEGIPNSSILINLSFISDLGCQVNENIYVDVINSRRVYIANAFSPNGDGVNDLFYIQGHIPNISNIKNLVIFDRWGSRVFERMNFLPNDEKSGWDGTYKGKDSEEDTYVFVAEIEFLDKMIGTYTGEVHLIR
ncbi:MAG: gliding motility-associated C-terminal domain-containing protein [Saprospiraceae bacterium]